MVKNRANSLSISEGMKEVLMNKCGIYSITNITNNKKYIGQSINILKRIRQHKSQLRNKIHINRYLQNSWNKNGEDNFSFDIIELCEINMLDTLEHKWILKYDTLSSSCGYNIRPVIFNDNKEKTLEANKARKIRRYICNTDKYFNILEELDGGVSVKKIVATYNVSQRLVNDIKNKTFNETHCDEVAEEDTYIRKQHLYTEVLKHGYNGLKIEQIDNLYANTHLAPWKFWQDYDRIKLHEMNFSNTLTGTQDNIDDEMFKRQYDESEDIYTRQALKEIRDELREEYGEFANDE